MLPVSLHSSAADSGRGGFAGLSQLSHGNHALQSQQLHLPPVANHPCQLNISNVNIHSSISQEAPPEEPASQQTAEVPQTPLTCPTPMSVGQG